MQHGPRLHRIRMQPGLGPEVSELVPCRRHHEYRQTGGSELRCRFQSDHDPGGPLSGTREPSRQGSCHDHRRRAVCSEPSEDGLTVPRYDTSHHLHGGRAFGDTCAIGARDEHRQGPRIRLRDDVLGDEPPLTVTGRENGHLSAGGARVRPAFRQIESSHSSQHLERRDVRSGGRHGSRP